MTNAMKKAFIIAGALLSGGGALALAAWFAYFFYLSRQEAAASGIIGGADKPTALFLASELDFPVMLAISPFLVFILAGAVMLAAALVLHIKEKKPED